MTKKPFLDDYYNQFKKAIFETDVTSQMYQMCDRVYEARQKGNKLIFVGNGASASISSHAAVDYTKQANIRSVCFNEAGLLTCFGNDYGYENWVEKALTFYADEGDVVVLISSSGKSPNIVNGAYHAKDLGLAVIAFTGFGCDNPVKAISDINFWVDSLVYNIIENTHQFWITTVCDLLVNEEKIASNNMIPGVKQMIDQKVYSCNEEKC